MEPALSERSESKGRVLSMAVPVPDQSEVDDLLGSLAVECGIVTDAQLRLAAGDLERLRAAPNAAPPASPSSAPAEQAAPDAAPPPQDISLAAVLLRRGFVSEATARFLHLLSGKDPIQRARVLAQRKADIALARELLSRGLVTPEQLHDCLSSQTAAEGVVYLPLPEVIESRGLLGHDELRHALPAHSTRILICKSCRAELTVFAYPFPIRYRCRNCSAVVDSAPLVEG